MAGQQVPERTSRLVRACGFAGMVGVLAFFSTVAVLHVFRPDVSPFGDFVSDYANGQMGMLFAIGVLTHGAGNLAIAAGLAAELHPGRTAWFGVIAFAAAGVGLLIAGIFRTDPTDASASVAGLVHSTTAIVSFATELLALLLLTSAFRTSPAWRAYARPSLTLAITAGAATLWMLAAVQTSRVPGLAERATLAAFMAWEFSTAYRLASRTPG